MVVLDQNRVVKAHAMIGDASGGRGHLLQPAQAWRGLASVEYSAARACYLLHILGGESGHAAEALQKIQGHALATQQLSGASRHHGNDFASDSLIAALLLEHASIVYQWQQLHAGDHLRLSSDEFPMRLKTCGNTGFGSDIAGADILLQRAPDDVHHAARPSSAALVLARCALYSASFWRMPSITCGGFLLVAFSSASWRSQFASTLSSCSISLSRRWRRAPVWASGVWVARANS